MSLKPPIKVAVTGAAGQISYSLLFRIASGEVFGPNQPVDLHLIELPSAVKAAEGVAMELNDCAYSTLSSIEIFDQTNSGFNGVHWAILVGSMPRAKGMQRSDLVRVNGPIFKQQGQDLEGADESLRCVVVGNPCNTNALIALRHARGVPPCRFFAMTALDESRARYQLAHYCGVSVSEVSHLVIWGNHSATMVPDYENALISNRKALIAVSDHSWFKDTFINTVQQRGMRIIEARGKSSAASAASACIRTIRSLLGFSAGVFSAGVYSDHNPYGVEDGLVYSFPLRLDENDEVQIVENFSHSDSMKARLLRSAEELMAERQAVADLLVV